MPDRYGVRLSLIHALPGVADAVGVPPQRVLAFGGLDWAGFRNPAEVVRRSQICATLQGLLRCSGDVAVGVRMAEATDPANLGLFGETMRIGRTLREALELQQRQMPWLQSGASVAMSTVGHQVQWMHRMHGTEPAEARLLNEGIAAFLTRLVRAASGDPGARLHVVLPHRPIAPPSRYEEAMRCAVSFAPGQDLVVRFDATLLDQPNRLARNVDTGFDPEVVAALPADCDLSDDRLMQSLHRIFEVTAMMGRLSLEGTAQALGYAPRSLQRRLSRIGTTFESVVDAWRHCLALELISRSHAGTAEIAARLGYGDASHFIRAFRRWQGVSPTAFRRERAPCGSDMAA